MWYQNLYLYFGRNSKHVYLECAYIIQSLLAWASPYLPEASHTQEHMFSIGKCLVKKRPPASKENVFPPAGAYRQALMLLNRNREAWKNDVTAWPAYWDFLLNKKGKWIRYLKWYFLFPLLVPLHELWSFLSLQVLSMVFSFSSVLWYDPMVLTK